MFRHLLHTFENGNASVAAWLLSEKNHELKADVLPHVSSI